MDRLPPPAARGARPALLLPLAPMRPPRRLARRVPLRRGAWMLPAARLPPRAARATKPVAAAGLRGVADAEALLLRCSLPLSEWSGLDVDTRRSFDDHSPLRNRHPGGLVPCTACLRR